MQAADWSLHADWETYADIHRCLQLGLPITDSDSHCFCRLVLVSWSAAGGCASSQQQRRYPHSHQGARIWTVRLRRRCFFHRVFVSKPWKQAMYDLRSFSVTTAAW